jgi:hypothetical protein
VAEAPAPTPSPAVQDPYGLYASSAPVLGATTDHSSTALTGWSMPAVPLGRTGGTGLDDLELESPAETPHPPTTAGETAWAMPARAEEGEAAEAVSSPPGMFGAAPGALGEPLATPVPAIPDTPVAAPLVADQLRDQLQPEQIAAASVAPSFDLPALEPLDTDSSGDHPAPSTLHDPLIGQAHHQASSPAAAPLLPGEHEEHAPAGTPADAETAQATPTEDRDLQPQAPRPAADAVATPQTGAGTLPAGQVETEPLEAGPHTTGLLPSGAVAAPRTTLRLNTDGQPLTALQAQLQQGLGRTVPLGLLLGRAAVRHLGLLDLPAAVLTDADGQPQATDLHAPLLVALDQLGQATPDQATGQAQTAQSRPTQSEPAQDRPPLLVTDAASLGLDELHVGRLSLSLGRLDRAGQLGLSLSGDVGAQQGAEFLRAVAATLATPALLLL